MALYVTGNVISRKLGWGEFWAIIEFSEFLMVAAVFLAMAYAEKTDTHVRMTLVTSRLGARKGGATRSVGLLLAFVAVAAFTYYNAGTLMQSIENNETRMGLAHFPVWPARTVILLGFLFTAIVLLVKLVDSIRATVAGKQLDAVDNSQF
jgi:TRAP-type mannitol/chloroaromatic compound transport system permease small subunit